MIGTLFAQEFRISRKTFGTTVAVLLLVVIVSFAIAALRVPVIGPLFFGLGVIAAILNVPVMLGLLVEQYWRTMYGKEGYFTMSIPVRGRTLYWAKVLYALVAVIVAVLVTLLGIAAAVVVFTYSQGQSLQASFDALRQALGVLDPAAAWFIGVTMAVQLIFTVVAGSALMSIGARARFNHLGFGAPVVGGVILYFAMQILGLAAMLFVPFGLRIAGPDTGAFVALGMWPEFAEQLQHPSSSGNPEVLGLGIVFVAIIATVWLAWAGVRSVERHTSLR